MGLLNKAEGKKTPDEQGKALIDRILRIPPGPAVPYTILSLLKAYGSFQVGICFSLENGVYTSFASVGLGIEKATIPQEKIYSPERASSFYFELNAEEKQFIDFMDSTLDIWCFLLDHEKPWHGLLILGYTDSSTIDPQSLSIILHEIRESIHPKDSVKQDLEKNGALDFAFDTALEPSASAEPGHDNGEVEKDLRIFLEQYHVAHSTIGGMVIDTQEGIEKISSMVSNFALVKELSTRYCLVLLPVSLDWNLIAHRLKNDLNIEIPLVFSAESSAEALRKIQPYL